LMKGFLCILRTWIGAEDSSKLALGFITSPKLL